MSRIRKTASIASILKRTNHKLLHSTCSDEVRQGMHSLLSTILMDANLYVGFGYLTEKHLRDVGSSELPGVSYYDSRTGAEVDSSVYFDEVTERRERNLPVKGGRYVREFPDESRRFYYVHRAIFSDYDALNADGEITPSTMPERKYGRIE
jgi:hypothetical protein